MDRNEKRDTFIDVHLTAKDGLVVWSSADQVRIKYGKPRLTTTGHPAWSR
jgi:hypothetical protein